MPRYHVHLGFASHGFVGSLLQHRPGDIKHIMRPAFQKAELFSYVTTFFSDIVSTFGMLFQYPIYDASIGCINTTKYTTPKKRVEHFPAKGQEFSRGPTPFLYGIVPQPRTEVASEI